MHRIATIPGGWTPDSDGIIFVEQTSAPIIILSAADTDIQVLAEAIAQLPKSFPDIRIVNLLQLQQQLSIDTYGDEVLSQAKVIILRLLGGRAYWPYGVEVIKQIADDNGITLMAIPGDDRPDPELMSHSTAALAQVNQLWRYFAEGGIENIKHALLFTADISLNTNYNPAPPESIPQVGLYPWKTSQSGSCRIQSTSLHVGVLFYRAHYLAGNTAPIDALCLALAERGIEPVPFYVSSLRESAIQAEVLYQLNSKNGKPIRVLLNTTSFAIASLNDETLNLDLWNELDVPVIQVILSSGTRSQWETQWRGLSPRDMAMNVALPEVDGRIISRAISFKTVQARNPSLETDVVTYAPVGDRINFVADLAANWARLAETPVEQKRVALILANYPNRDGRLANGVGLDTPESCIQILRALQNAGYTINHIPENGDALMKRLTQGITNDPEAREYRPVNQFLRIDEYHDYFQTLPKSIQQAIQQRWGEVEGEDRREERRDRSKELDVGWINTIPIAGIQLGNIFIGIQPSRGYDADPSLNYHAPDLEPTHEYLAFYQWLRQSFGAQAIIHIGKHGNLEWLPGKSIALSETCYPEIAFGALPHLYPFIVNDPGEGAQAKRRAQAVIIDHLTPPMTRAELYGPLQQLEHLIDEYYEAQSLDPTRAPHLSERIQHLIRESHLDQELVAQGNDRIVREEPLHGFPSFEDFIAQADGYLCELKEAQIRDGLHIFGQCPKGRQLRDLIVAIARQPAPRRIGLTRAIAHAWGLDFDPLTVLPSDSLPEDMAVYFPTLRTAGELVEVIEHAATRCVEALLTETATTDIVSREREESKRSIDKSSYLQQELDWLDSHLIPALTQTDHEITNLLRGLNARYIESGASGAPTRGRTDVLPTGRNFFSVDIRAIPTESAWDVGRKAAEVLIERYTQENGEFPKSLGLSVWGTSTMRTGGDDIAEALALLGVQPLWDGPSRRVIDFEILPLSVLNRPRVDVTLRVSGFFRDGFANLIDLFNRAVEAVAMLDESAEWNPLAAQTQQDTLHWIQAGLSQEQATEQSLYRVFGSKPGAYGAGLQGLIEAQNWSSDDDLARAYINWSSYAYTGQNREGRGYGLSAPEAFKQRLQQMQIVLHNQDNREHDILDSDDYYQFQGGMVAAVRSLQNQEPITYFGDHSLPENPRIRQLREEIARVYRSRVVNPKWIAGALRHGYKGAFEMAATVDYLFAYDSTTHCVANHIYEGIANAYVLDDEVQQFVQLKNPWALRDMAERLLEANQRGLWEGANGKLLDELRAILHQAEGAIENHITASDSQTIFPPNSSQPEPG